MSISQDRTLTCRDCGAQFIFTAGEQDFYQSRGLLNEPGRCAECRAARKANRGDRGGYAYSSGGDSYGGSQGYDRSDRPRRELFSATCSACGQEAKVPFQPRGDKPVYCSSCFENERGGRSY